MNQELAPFDWNAADYTSFHGKSNMISIYMQECLQKNTDVVSIKTLFLFLGAENRKTKSRIILSKAVFIA